MYRNAVTKQVNVVNRLTGFCLMVSWLKKSGGLNNPINYSLIALRISC